VGRMGKGLTGIPMGLGEYVGKVGLGE
jgi:hypothetical protein